MSCLSRDFRGKPELRICSGQGENITSLSFQRVASNDCVLCYFREPPRCERCRESKIFSCVLACGHGKPAKNPFADARLSGLKSVFLNRESVVPLVVRDGFAGDPEKERKKRCSLKINQSLLEFDRDR